MQAFGLPLALSNASETSSPRPSYAEAVPHSSTPINVQPYSSKTEPTLVALLGAASGIGVHALLVEQQDAGAEGQQHDGDARDDAEAGRGGRRTMLAAPNDDMARDRDQKLKDAAFQQP